MTIHAYIESHRLSYIKQRPSTITILCIVALFLLALILTPISLAIGKVSTAQSPTPVSKNSFTAGATITATNTPTPTQTAPAITPTPSYLYKTDFSQGGQGWLATGNTQQWIYNNTDKALESDGSALCCTPQSQLQNIVLVAPYTMKTSDYASDTGQPFSSGAKVGIENYNCLLQVQSFVVYPL